MNILECFTRPHRRITKRQDSGKPLRRQVAEIDRKFSRAGELSLQLKDPVPMLRMVDEFERERIILVGEIANLNKDAATRNAPANTTDDQVAAVLKEAANPKALLKTVVEWIALARTRWCVRYTTSCPSGCAS